MEDNTAETTSSIIDSLINPATVPIRTSSRSSSSVINGYTNGDSKAGNTGSPSTTPRKHRSMASVPEQHQRRDRRSGRRVIGIWSRLL